MRETDPVDLPPAFPPWMRAADPILAREDTNGLFQAFRTRRKRRRKVLTQNFGGAVNAAEQLAPFVFLLGLSGWAGTLSIPLFYAGGFMMVVGQFLARRAAGLPDTVAGLFDRQGDPKVLALMATDVWLAPATGGEVIEAMYLERREATLATLPAAAFVAAAVSTMAYLRAVWAPIDELWKEVVPVALLVAIFARGAHLLLLHETRLTAAKVARQWPQYWKARGEGDTSYFSDYRWRLVQLGLGVVLVAAMAGVALLCLGTALRGSDVVVKLQAHRQLVVSITFGGVWLALEGLAHSRKSTAGLGDLDDALRSAWEPYETFMRRTVLGDGD